MKSTCMRCLYSLQKAYVLSFIRRISTTHINCSDIVHSPNTRRDEVAKLPHHSKITELNFKHRQLYRVKFGVHSFVDQQIITDKNRLLENLRSNVIYEDELITAVSKLSGTPVFGKYQDYHRSVSADAVSSETAGNHGDQDSAVSIASVLPELGEHFNCGQLDIVLGNPRYHSGVVILSKTDEAKRRIQKSVAAAQTQKKTHLKYLVVTNWIPSGLLSGQEEILLVRESIGDRVMTLKSEKSRPGDRQKGLAILTVFDARTLTANPGLGAALLRVNVNKAKWDSVEMFLTEKLCSALGEHHYSSRVGSVLGVAIRVETHIAASATQILTSPLKKKLGIHDDDLHLLPLHVHRHQVELPSFPDKRSGPLVISAPLPDYFQATLDKLELLLPTDR